MKPVKTIFLLLFTLILIAAPVLAQVDLKNVLPVYPGAKTSAFAAIDGVSMLVTTPDDTKAVMIFYRKMLVYDGWQVISGSVLKNDPLIVFERGKQWLKMQADSADENTTRILFTMSK